MALRNHVVAVKNRGGKRSGRGFSRGELEKAGIGLSQALRLGLPVDTRRRTVHDENVKLAEQQLSSLKPAPKTSGRAKKGAEKQ